MSRRVDTLRAVLRVVLPLGVLALGAGAAAFLASLREEPVRTVSEPPSPLVRTVRVEPRSHRFVVRARGTVKSRVESRLAAEVAGRVVSVAETFAPGGFFHAGEVLVEIDAADQELALAQARLELARAERRLAEEEADAAVARREWEAHGVGESTPLVLRDPQVAEARAALAAARASVEHAERELARTRVRAPYAGRVAAKHVDVGDYVQPGAALARVYATDFAEVRLPLADAELAHLELPLGYRDAESADGPAVTLEATFAGERHRWTGRIVRTEGEIDPETRMVVLVARVADPWSDEGESPRSRPPLAVGAFVEARIEGRVAESVAVLPRTALRGRAAVWVLDDQERLRSVPVRVLRAGPEEVVVDVGADGALAAGDRVVVSPLEIATEGMRLRALAADDARGDAGAAAGGDAGAGRDDAGDAAAARRGE